MNQEKKLNILKELLTIGLIFSCVLSLTGIFGKGIWPLDLTSHFPLQYLAAQLAGLALIIISKLQKALAYCLMLIIIISINAFQVCSYYWPTTHVKQMNSPITLKILHMNVLFLNQNYKAVHHLIESTETDILSLQEVDKKWLRALEKRGSLRQFPYQIIHRDSRNILASRIPLKNARIIPVGNPSGVIKDAILMADFDLAKEKVTILTLHPPVPVWSEYHDRYKEYFIQLAVRKKAMNENKILVGDLNTTPWSGNYPQYLSSLNLRDARAHQGFYPTWNTFLPMFFIPIDHVLVSKRFFTRKQQVGPFNGSDHLPVYIELGFTP